MTDFSNIRSLYEIEPVDNLPSVDNQNVDQSAYNMYSELFRAKIYQHFLLLEASGTGGLAGGLVENPKCSPMDFEDSEKRRIVMREKPFAIVTSDPFPEDKQDLLFQTYGDVRVRIRRNLRARISRIPSLDVFSRWLVENETFQKFILLVIAYNCVTLGLQAEYGDRPGANAAFVRSILDCLDILALTIFMFEILLKWMVSFRDFWDNPWNTFDFAITLFTFVTTVIGIIGHLDPSNKQLSQVEKTMRAFQVLRVMRVLTRSQGIKVIVFTVTKSLSDMGSILVLFILFMYIFLIAGVICMSDLKNIASQMSSKNITDPTVLLYGYRFQNLYWGFLTLYQIFTIDHWYAMLHGSWCQLLPDCTFATIYMMLWLLIGSLIFRNIFAGVVVNTFQNLRKTVSSEEEEEQKEVPDTALSEFKEFIDVKITEETDQLTSRENLVIHTMEGADTGEDHHSADDPLVKLNRDGARFLSDYKKQLRLLDKLVQMKSTEWTKELMFRYFELMEKLQENVHARQEIIKLMDEWLMGLLNKSDPEEEPSMNDRTKQLKQMLRNRLHGKEKSS